MSTSLPPYSVLMSYYRNDSALDMRQAIESMLQQSHAPTQLVIVQDGPVSDKLAENVQDFANRHPAVFTLLKLPNNLGLGRALQLGLQACSCEFVARMDADDISLPDRLRKQLSLMIKDDGLAAVGAGIAEFAGDGSKAPSFRIPPSDSEILRKFSFRRNPLNHQTVVFRKSAVLGVGGYVDMLYFEDYFLWLRLLSARSRIANVGEILVNANTNHMVVRRHGWTYAKREYKFMVRCLQDGIMPLRYFMLNVLLRIPLRLIPLKALTVVYCHVVRAKAPLS